MKRKYFGLVFPIISLVLFSCEFIFPVSHVTPLSPTSLIVFDKCQIEHFIKNEVLEIKAGHFARDIYILESGKEESGLSANLWILIQGSIETTLSIRVHTGQTVTFRDYEILILRVAMGTTAGFVEFEITT